jgi:hypothetical protein
VKGIATRTCHARADDFADDEAAGNVFQFLGHVFAQRTQRPAAIGAGLARGQHLGSALQMLGERGAAVFAPFRLFVGRTGVVLLGVRGLSNLAILVQIERQLVRRFGFRAEPRLAMACKLMLELLDLQRLRLRQIEQPLRRMAQFLGISRQGFERLQHCRIIPSGDREVKTMTLYSLANSLS